MGAIVGGWPPGGIWHTCASHATCVIDGGALDMDGCRRVLSIVPDVRFVDSACVMGLGDVIVDGWSCPLATRSHI